MTVFCKNLWREKYLSIQFLFAPTDTSLLKKLAKLFPHWFFPSSFNLASLAIRTVLYSFFCLSFRMLNTKCFLDEWAWTRPLKSWTQTQSRQPLQSAVSSFRKRLASIQVKTFTFWNALFIEWKYQVFYQKLWKLSLKASKSNSIVIFRNSLLWSQVSKINFIFSLK